MALKHILLGTMAILGPQNGYMLNKMYLEPRRPKLSLIYKSLKEMIAKKWIKCEIVQGDKKQMTKTYSITPAGFVQLRRWLGAKNDIVTTREPIASKIWFSNFNNKDVTIDVLKSFVKYRREEIKYYQAQLKICTSDEPAKYIASDSLNRSYASIAIKYMITKGKSDVRWANRAMKDIANMGNDSPHEQDTP